MIRTLIIEDEAPAVRQLKRIIEKADIALVIIEVLDSVASAVDWLKNNPSPDLLLVDIHLADGLSFDIFKQVQINSPIIFTTAYDQYALKAFELASIDYLLKPIDEKKLEKSIKKLHLFSTKKEDNHSKIESLLKHFEQKEYKTRFLVSFADQLLSISESELAYFRAEGKYLYLITQTGKQFIYNSSLDELEKKLDSRFFFRLNRQYIARIGAISGIFTHFKGKLKVKIQYCKEEDIYVSREKASKFRAWLDGK